MNLGVGIDLFFLKIFLARTSSLLFPCMDRFNQVYTNINLLILKDGKMGNKKRLYFFRVSNISYSLKK